MIVGGVALSQAVHLPFGSVQAPDAGFFPLALSVLLLLFAVAVVANSFVRTTPKPEFSPRSWYVLTVGCVFVIYALSINKVGFVVATTIVLLLLMRSVGQVSWAKALPIAIPGVVLTYLLFIELGVPLPRGVLPF
jgi:hypothetical protein